MPQNYTAGNLCCTSDGCAMIYDETIPQWEKIPHVTDISFTQQAQEAGLVTSDSAGEEIALCGPVRTSGTLAIACHDGLGPFPLCINGQYRFRWSHLCDEIFTAGAPVGVPDASVYYEAVVKITSKPVPLPISQPGAIIYAYSWRLVEWINLPTCQSETESW